MLIAIRETACSISMLYKIQNKVRVQVGNKKSEKVRFIFSLFLLGQYIIFSAYK